MKNEMKLELITVIMMLVGSFLLVAGLVYSDWRALMGVIVLGLVWYNIMFVRTIKKREER